MRAQPPRTCSQASSVEPSGCCPPPGPRLPSPVMRGPCPGPLSLLTSAGRNPPRPRRSQGPALPDSAACHPRKASGRLGDCTSSSATRVTPCPSPALSNPGLLFSSPAPGGEQRPWGWRCSWPGGLGALRAPPALSRRCPQPSPQFGVQGCAGGPDTGCAALRARICPCWSPMAAHHPHTPLTLAAAGWA